MKTNTPNALYKLLTLIVAAFTMNLTTYSLWAAEAVPFKGIVQGTTVGVAPDPAGVTLTLHATGRATHLGRSSREEVLLFNPLTGTLNGTIVFTAANGDQLFGIVAGGFTSPTTATGTYSFTGGTGRFAESFGSADFVVTTADGISFTAAFEGTLSSIGSNKR
jgi:hypothetical protein